MVRSIFTIFNIFLWTGIIGSLVMLVSLIDIHGRIIGKLTRLWAIFILKASGIPYRITGLKHLDRDKNYFFASNHSSSLDIPLIFAGLPYQLVSIAKKELKKIPIMGWAMIRAKHIFIDRSNSREAKKSLMKAIGSLQKHPRSILIFPEGTRSTDGEIHKFKKGGLGLAIDIGMPVVPVASCGTADVLSKRSMRFRKCDVELRLGEPVETVSWSSKDKGELAKYIQEQVVQLRESWLEEKKNR